MNKMTISEYLHYEQIPSPQKGESKSGSGTSAEKFEENQIIEEYEGSCEKCEQVTLEKACPVCG